MLLPKQQIAALAEQRAVHAAFAWFRLHAAELSRWQMELAAIPAPLRGEQRRAAWLCEKFKSLGVRQVTTDEAGNVLAYLPGAKPQNECLALAAHMDTVFPAGTPVQIQQEGLRLCGPGISDNASGLTALLAVAAAMHSAELQPATPVLFVCTVGEEGEGDLRGMRHLFQSSWRDRIRAVLVVDGAGNETIVNHALGSRRFEVTLRGEGGHSWSDFGVANPIAAMAQAIAEFYKTPVAEAARKKSAYNVGVIEGGTSVNSIPQSATMRVDLRSEAAEQLDVLEHALRNCVSRALVVPQNGLASRQEEEAAAAAPKHKPLRCEFKKIGDRPAAELTAGARILQVVRAVDAHLNIRSHLHCSSTDANIPLSLGVEAVSIGAGGTGGAAHTLNEWFEPTGRDLGLKRILLAALALAES